MTNAYRYLMLIVLLLGLTLVFLTQPTYRIPTAVAIGSSYFLWGLLTHWLDRNLHWVVALEYLGFSLLAVIMLIWLSLRA